MARPNKGERAAIALRLDVDLLHKVDAWALRSRLDRTSALALLIGAGLAASTGERFEPSAVADARASGPALKPRASSASRPAPRASAPVQAAAAAVSDIKARAVSGLASRPKARRIVGFDPLSGAPIYGEA